MDIMQHEKDIPLTIQDIMVIKLYTDFTKLQSELKKSYRLESVNDVIEQYSPNPDHGSLRSQTEGAPKLSNTVRNQ